MNEIEKLYSIRKSILNMMHYSKSSHIGSCLSIVEILYVLYFKVLRVDPDSPIDPARDKFILSKGHGSAALYATLAERGFFSKKYLDEFYVNGGRLPGHLDMSAVPGIEVSSGSLGHGLSIGAGMAIANKLAKSEARVFVLVGDGECNEGSIWEAAMFSSHHLLDNLTVIIDYNKLQGFGETNEVVNQKSIINRWQAFGWETYEINGHESKEIYTALNKKQLAPKAIIAHTIKGKGISFMENKLEWHYKSPNEEQLNRALIELGDFQ
ncbi:transketolase [Paenibacillus sp. CGMCC 1.16610]|uniref:Transketolase n=1 Tax=Paenibacillus anseongense TaxID=2682845 RepID=A0ABW9U312_9BACL|nr:MULTISPECIES: transketolase [Paenibacillus]MBA2942392.1 transketolase [Paenibacillus sp. CGMCC 1.16610]MVQ34467.1 transketolase [Paenibacillus anseongense]